jgi:hypothetical protein
MRPSCVVLMSLLASAALHASEIGVTVNGICEAGSCPPSVLPFSTTATLPLVFNLTLSDGDEYLINGSFSAVNDAPGSGFSVESLFQVTYEGNAGGGTSEADSVSVELFETIEVASSSVSPTEILHGAFGPTIAGSSTATQCVDSDCLGPVNPPGSFDLTSSFSLTSSGGDIQWDVPHTSNFGAGSPVGSYIVWGRTTPIAPVPEPSYYGPLALGVAAGFYCKSRRRRV